MGVLIIFSLALVGILSFSKVKMVFAAMANAERIKHMAIAKHALQSNKCKKKN